jgi:hypothetical protein
MSSRRIPKGKQMKSLTVRLPSTLAASLVAEAKDGNTTVSEVVRSRLELASKTIETDRLAPIRDLIGSIKGLPPDLSSRTKHYLALWGYGKDRPH